jgi:hypothetical protein
MIHLVMFLAAAGVDILWAKYTVAAAERRAWYASTWSIGIYLAGSLSTWVFIHQPDTIWASCAGAFVGTYIGVRRGKA